MNGPLSLIPKSNFKSFPSGKFAPKLSEQERCAVLALVKAGIRRDRVAEAFGIDRRTVGHIANDQSLRYKPTREKYKNLGHEGFIKEYLTEEVALKVAAVTASNEEQKPVKRGPSSRANRMAGEHKVQPEQCAYEHRIEVRFLNTKDGVDEEGWYYRDLDSKHSPEAWLHNGDDSRMTSHACYDAAVENLLDE